MHQDNINLEDGFYKGVLDNIYDGIYFTDRNRKITYWNHGAERITGYRADEVVGRHCWDNILVHVDECGTPLCNKGCPAAATIGDGEVRESDIYLHHKDGHRVPVRVRVTPLRDTAGEVRGAVEIFTVWTGQDAYVARIRELEEMALLDPLTELGNRRYAEIHLQARLTETDRYGWTCGVLFIDIDNFKDVNDTYGHPVGDKILRMVGMTLATNVRQFDTVSRWGGEEFVAILANVNEVTLESLSEKLRTLVERSNLEVREDILSVTISVGATLSRPSDSVDSLIRRADELMYQSKATGRNRVTAG